MKYCNLSKELLAIIMMMVMLALITGCDSNAQTITQPMTLEVKVEGALSKETPSSDVENANNATNEKIKQLVKQYADEDFTLSSYSEMELDGANAIALSFTVPLNPNQDFNKLVHITDVKSGKVDGGWELSDDLLELRFRHIEPNRTLKINVSNDLIAVTGQAIEGEHRGSVGTLTIETQSMFPSLSFTQSGYLLPQQMIDGLPVLALNVNKADVDFFRIKSENVPKFLTNYATNFTVRYWDSEEYLSKAELVYSARYDLNVEKNTRTRLILPLHHIEELKKEGVYIALMREAGKIKYRTSASFFMISDLGLAVNKYASSSDDDYYVHHLSSGKAIKGAMVSLMAENGQLLINEKTDKNGWVRLPRFAKASIAMATLNGQTTILKISRGTSSLDLSSYDIKGRKHAQAQLFVFAPRNLYRPEEKVQFNALLRDYRGKPVLERPIKMDIINPANEVIYTASIQPKEGLYQTQYQLQQNMPTGTWQARFDFGESTEIYRFYVEEFLPERMALTLSSSQDKPISNKQPFKIKLKGHYLYGAPAAGNQIQGQLYMRVNRSLNDFKGFIFGSMKDAYLSRSLTEVSMNLSDSGEGEITLNPQEWGNIHSPVDIIFQASLLEPGGRAVTRRVNQSLWPNESIIGVRPLFGKEERYNYDHDRYENIYAVGTNQPTDFEVIYVDGQMKKLSTLGIKAKVIEEIPPRSWAWSDERGWYRTGSKKEINRGVYDVSAQRDDAGKLSLNLQDGRYRIEIYDDSNKKLTTDVNFVVGRYWWSEQGNSSITTRPDQLKIILDKESYLSGETARLAIHSTYAAEGYLNVVNSEGALFQKPISLQKGINHESIEINDSWQRQDIYLLAKVVNYSEEAKETGIKRAIGIQHLPLFDTSRKLSLSFDMPEKLESEKQTKVKLTVNPESVKGAGKLTALISAVDSGVLNINDYVTPDPFAYFFERKHLDLDLFDVYGQIVLFKGKLAEFRFGGDSVESAALRSRGGKKPLNEVKIVSQQLLPITFDEHGVAEVEMMMPDFNGELRFMVQAWGDDVFGSTEKKVTVSAPLIVEISKPRFMASLDKSQFNLMLHNLSGEQQNLSLKFETEGLIRITNDMNAMDSIVLEKNALINIPINVIAGAGLGSGAIKLHVSNQQDSIDYKKQWHVGVRPAYPAQSFQWQAIIEPNQQWRLSREELKDLDLIGIEADMIVTDIPPLNTSKYVKELYAYPYGCLEQTTSGVYPSLYLNASTLKALNIKGQTDQVRREAVQAGIERIISMQKNNGGFGFWSNHSSEVYWGTAYATDFLLRARELGYQVDNKSINLGLERLKSYILNNQTLRDVDSITAMSVKAYAALILAKQNRIPLSEVGRLARELDKTAHTGLASTQIGIAYHLLGDGFNADQWIKSAQNKERPTQKYISDYGSNIRDYALQIVLLAENGILPAQKNPLLFKLPELLRTRQYLSTQENGALFLASRYLLDASIGEWKVKLNDNLFTQNSPLRKNYDEPQLRAKDLVIDNLENKPLYVTADVTGYPEKFVEDEKMRGNLTVSKHYYDISGREMRAELQEKLNMTSGELIAVVMHVKAKNRSYSDILVVDLLPAGLELENQNLANSSAVSSAFVGDDETLNCLNETIITHKEFRDDRFVASISANPYRDSCVMYLARAVTPGEYNIPPVKAESMYEPDVMAMDSQFGVLTVNRDIQ